MEVLSTASRRQGQGVDEHVWRRTRRGDKYVTVIIDLTGIRDGTGPARLLDMVEAAPNRRSRPGSPSAPTHGATARSLLETGGFRPVLSPESAPAMGWVEHGNPPRSSLRRRSTWTDTESLIRTRIVR